MVEVDRLRHGLVQRGPALAVGGGGGVLGDGDAAALGQAPHGLDEVDVLDLAHEGDGVTRLLAPEAVEHAHLGVDTERRGLLLVEGAQPHPARALLLERGVLADERHDVRGGPHTDDVLVRDGHARTVPRRRIGGSREPRRGPLPGPRSRRSPRRVPRASAAFRRPPAAALLRPRPPCGRASCGPGPASCAAAVLRGRARFLATAALAGRGALLGRPAPCGPGRASWRPHLAAGARLVALAGRGALLRGRGAPRARWPAPPGRRRAGRWGPGTASSSRSRSPASANTAIDSGSPPCSPHTPILSEGRVARPRVTPRRTSSPTPSASTVSNGLCLRRPFSR